MKLHEQMMEVEFIEAIDASVSFEDEEECEKIVRIGSRISDNAALMIGYELVADTGFVEIRLRLLDQLQHERQIPLIRAAVPVINALIREIPVDKDALEQFFEYCKSNRCYTGLGIVSIADKEKDRECDMIIEQWQKQFATEKRNVNENG